MYICPVFISIQEKTLILNSCKMKKKKLQTLRLMGCLAGLVLMMFSCSSDSEETNTFDPNKPIVCESFYPSGGPISTQVILRGSNFGSDKNAVRVFFNTKEAPVINVNEDHILVLAPRLPGENVKIKVCIGEKEATFDGEFDYQIQTNNSAGRGRHDSTFHPLLPTATTRRCRRPRCCCSG